jgi:hypothetical protein
MGTHEDSKSRIHDLFGMILGAFALAMLLSIRWQIDTSGPDPFYKGPMIFPLLVLSLILGASLPSVWRMVQPVEFSSWRLDGQGFPKKSLRVLGLLILYLVGLAYLGLELSTSVFLFISLWIVGQRSWAKLLGIPICVTALLFFVFKYFLDVWFPTPVLWELLME